MKAALLALLLLVTFSSPTSHAMSREVRGLITMGEYGLMGGTILGLVSYPLTGNVRSIFIGSSVGLYLGLAVGTYYAIRANEEEPPPWTSSRPPVGFTEMETALRGAPLLEINWAVARF